MSSSPDLVRGVDFVGVPTRDIARAAVFYGETLGLRQSVYMEERHFSEYETGNLTISVYNAEQMGIGHNANPNPIALHVDDVAAARKLLEERGVEFHGETLDTGVCHMAIFADPDGNSLMLHHRYAPRETLSWARVARPSTTSLRTVRTSRARSSATRRERTASR
jgi:predicted enzyme related to lactoylglutathione lyase